MRDVAQKLRRLLYLVPHIAKYPDGVAIESLAEDLGMSEQQLMSDLDLLTQVGPPMGDPGEYLLLSVEDGRVFVDLAQRLTRPLRLTPAEGCSLLLGIQALKHQRALPINDALESAEKKLLDALGSDALMAEQLAQRTVVAPDNPSLTTQLSKLADASQNYNQLRIDYVSASRDAFESRDVDPYGIVHHAGSWYLVGYCHKRNDIRTFRIDRIVELKVLDTNFAPPKDFDLAQYKREHLYVPSADAVTVRIHLDAQAATRVGADWPAGELVCHADGSADIMIDCEGFEWVTSWVLSFGRHAKIVSPQSAVDAIKGKIEHLGATVLSAA